MVKRQIIVLLEDTSNTSTDRYLELLAEELEGLLASSGLRVVKLEEQSGKD